jgi:DNA-binding MarR family transcriptional regulator
MTQHFPLPQGIDGQIAELRAFRRALRVLERELGLSLDRETECCSVSVSQCHLLLETDLRPGASLTELADALALDKSTLSRTADSLRIAGLIARGAEAGDRRRTSINLTGAGIEKVNSINRTCDASYQRLFAYIPEDKRPMVIEATSLLAEAMRRKRKDERDHRCSGEEAAEGREES